MCVGHARTKRGADMVTRPKRLGLASYLLLFLNNTSEVNKELLVRCPETIQHICMNILVLNKTIIFVWLTKIIQILGAKPKLLGSGNKCTVDQDTVHYKFAQWIFQALKAWCEANVVFS
jgi:hypothetical protein